MRIPNIFFVFEKDKSNVCDLAKSIPVSELALDVVVLVRVLAHLHQLALHVVQVHRRPVGGSADGGRYLE